MESRIVLARKKANLSQIELAEKMEIHPSTLNGYEKGKHDPKSDGLISIATICNVTTDYLLGISDDIEKKSHQEKIKPDMSLKKIIDYYNKMDDVGKNALLDQAEFLFCKYEKRENAAKMA